MLVHLLAGLSNFPWLISLVVVLTALIYWAGVSSYSLISHVELPGPKPWPYVGNLIEAMCKLGGLHKAFMEYDKKYGKVYKMYLGREPIIVVTDVEMLKHILVKEFDKFRNRPEFLAGNAPLNKGLFGARDGDWRRARSILTPTFSASKLKEIVPIIEEAITFLLPKFDNFSKEEKSVDVSTAFGQFTLDVILSAGFGLKADIQTNPDPEMLQRILTVFSAPVYIRAFTMFPFFRQVRKVFHLNPIQHVPYLAKLAKEVLDLRKSGTPGRRDLVQLMLEAEEMTENGVKKLTEEEIIGQCIVFLVAGSETSGATLAFIAYYLAHHSEVQNKLLCEIDQAVSSRDHQSTYEFIQSLEYLDQVICEVLRLATVGYVNVRECMETCVIGGVEFPAGVSVYIPSFVVHRNPEFWPEPEKFDPDRFLPNEVSKRPAFSHMPFGLGPKQCIGIRLAQLELKMALVEILQRVKFVRGVDSTERLEFRAATILQPRDPVLVKVVARSRGNNNKNSNSNNP